MNMCWISLLEKKCTSPSSVVIVEGFHTWPPIAAIPGAYWEGKVMTRLEHLKSTDCYSSSAGVCNTPASSPTLPLPVCHSNGNDRRLAKRSCSPSPTATASCNAHYLGRERFAAWDREANVAHSTQIKGHSSHYISICYTFALPKVSCLRKSPHSA